MLGEGTERGRTTLRLILQNTPIPKIGEQCPHPVGESLATGPIQRHPCVVNAMTEKVHAMPRAIEEGLAFVAETKPLQLFPLRGSHRFENGFPIRPDHEVIHVADIGAAAERCGDVPVDGIEVEIRTMLRDQAADGKSARTARTMGVEDL